MKLDRDALRVLAAVTVAAADDNARGRILRCVHLAGTKQGLVLTASDAWIWARRVLAVDVPEHFIGQSVCLPAGALGRVARTAARALDVIGPAGPPPAASAELDTTMLALTWQDVTESTAVLTAYNGTPWPVHAEDTIYRDPDELGRVILWPALLQRAAQALGAFDIEGVQLQFAGEHSPVRVTRAVNREDYVWLMPQHRGTVWTSPHANT